MVPHTFNICSWNIHGTTTKTYSGICQNKLTIDELCDNLKYDIIALQETHACPNTEIHMNGYFCYRADRQRHEKAKNHSGGLAVLVKNCYKNHVTFVKSDSFALWIKIRADLLESSNDIYLACVYLPPCNSPIYKRNSEDPFDELLKDIAIYTNKGDIMLHCMW